MKVSRFKDLYISLFVGLLFSIPLWIIFVWIGAQNNNQGEYFNTVTGVWDIGHVSLQFVLCFMIVTLFISLPLFLFLHTRSVINKTLKK